MRFVLYVEGDTDAKVLPAFLSRWLNPQLKSKVRISTVNCGGWPNFQSEIARKVGLLLSGKDSNDVIAAIGLLDLYGPTFYPPDRKSVDERRSWAKQHFEGLVSSDRFAQHFAVHELEAWLLSQSSLFPQEVGRALPGRAQHPESVNFDEPPAKLLERLYREKLRRRYGKVNDGSDLFTKLDPDIAYQKCPSLKVMLDDMLARAKQFGL